MSPTHKEQIDVPDGFQIQHTYNGEARQLVVYLKPVPPPEPEIENCRYCKGELMVAYYSCNDFRIRHVRDACTVTFHGRYPTRLAAIQACNRRA